MKPAPSFRWVPGHNPLTRERPFQEHRLNPIEAASYACCLGPALCLAPDLLHWIVLILLLPLSLLALTVLPLGEGPAGDSRRVLLLVTLGPLLLGVVQWLLQVTELRESLPLAGLSLVLCLHGSALLYLKSIHRPGPEEARTWSVRASLALPLPLLFLALLGFGESLLPATGIPGLPRLLGLLLLLSAFQLLLRRLRRRRA